MTHYAHILTLERLEVMAFLGFYDEERSTRQRVEISVRLYFPEAPACAHDDHAEFLHYGLMAEHLTAWAQEGEFRLVEYMGTQAHMLLRSYLDARGYEAVRLAVRLHKCNPPVPNLLGGSSFVRTDLPPGATTAHAPVL